MGRSAIAFNFLQNSPAPTERIHKAKLMCHNHAATVHNVSDDMFVGGGCLALRGLISTSRG